MPFESSWSKAVCAVPTFKGTRISVQESCVVKTLRAAEEGHAVRFSKTCRRKFYGLASWERGQYTYTFRLQKKPLDDRMRVLRLTREDRRLTSVLRPCFQEVQACERGSPRYEKSNRASASDSCPECL